jgi:uncharacterized protein
MPKPTRFPGSPVRAYKHAGVVRHTCILLIFGATLTLAALPAKPAGVVNDFAGQLSAGETEALEGLSRCVFKSLQCAMVVAILPSLDNGDIDQTANELYNRWGIGSHGSNNGVLI